MLAKDVESGFIWKGHMVMCVNFVNSHPILCEYKETLACDIYGNHYYKFVQVHHKYVIITFRVNGGTKYSMTFKPDEDIDCRLSSHPYRY